MLKLKKRSESNMKILRIKQRWRLLKRRVEDFRIEEVFSLKDTEEQTGQFHSQAKLTHLIHIQMYISTDINFCFHMRVLIEVVLFDMESG